MVYQTAGVGVEPSMSERVRDIHFCSETRSCFLNDSYLSLRAIDHEISVKELIINGDTKRPGIRSYVFKCRLQ